MIIRILKRFRLERYNEILLKIFYDQVGSDKSYKTFFKIMDFFCKNLTTSKFERGSRGEVGAFSKSKKLAMDEKLNDRILTNFLFAHSV